MNATIEAAAMRETEDALRDLMNAAANIGLPKESLAMMLRALADEYAPPFTVTMQ